MQLLILFLFMIIMALKFDKVYLIKMLNYELLQVHLQNKPIW